MMVYLCSLCGDFVSRYFVKFFATLVQFTLMNHIFKFSVVLIVAQRHTRSIHHGGNTFYVSTNTFSEMMLNLVMNIASQVFQKIVIEAMKKNLIDLPVLVSNWRQYQEIVNQ